MRCGLCRGPWPPPASTPPTMACVPRTSVAFVIDVVGPRGREAATARRHTPSPSPPRSLFDDSVFSRAREQVDGLRRSQPPPRRRRRKPKRQQRRPHRGGESDKNGDNEDNEDGAVVVVAAAAASAAVSVAAAPSAANDIDGMMQRHPSPSWAGACREACLSPRDLGALLDGKWAGGIGYRGRGVVGARADSAVAPDSRCPDCPNGAVAPLTLYLSFSPYISISSVTARQSFTPPPRPLGHDPHPCPTPRSCGDRGRTGRRHLRPRTGLALIFFGP